MNILVCVKQVPDTTEIKIDPVTNTLMRAGVPSIVNPFDAYALETAARLKDAVGGQITVISMGPDQAKAALKECLSVGADQAFLISGREFGGSDTLATSYILSCAVKAVERRIGEPFDLIFCGKQAIDGDTGQVGPELAEHLGYAQITYASNVVYENNSLKVKRESDEGFDYLTCDLPCIITMVKTPFEPRYATLRSKLSANKAVIPVLGIADLDIDSTRCGLKGSPTKVRKTFTPVRNKHGVIIEGKDASDAAKDLIGMLWERKIV